MKKVSFIITSLLLLFALTACGSQNREIADNNSDDSDILQTDRGNTKDEQTFSETANETSNRKTLVVYYSATGNTKRVAEVIAETTGGELFELEPIDPYTDEDLNYNDDNSRVSREYTDESLRDVDLVEDTVDDWQDVTEVYIGYPVWWGIAAWPVDGFIEANDFTGKTVIPFCTSASSGLGESGELLKKAAGTGDWLEGKRFSSRASETEITEWVQGFGY